MLLSGVSILKKPNVATNFAVRREGDAIGGPAQAERKPERDEPLVDCVSEANLIVVSHRRRSSHSDEATRVECRDT